MHDCWPARRSYSAAVTIQYLGEHITKLFSQIRFEKSRYCIWRALPLRLLDRCVGYAAMSVSARTSSPSSLSTISRDVRSVSPSVLCLSSDRVCESPLEDRQMALVGSAVEMKLG